MIEGKIIWITGASSGIGKALAIQCAQRNAMLILSGRNIEELNEVKKICIKYTSNVSILPFDLLQTDNISTIYLQAISTYGKIDILVNNGGISQRSLAIETPIEIDRKIMEVNYFGNIALTKAVVPDMQKREIGKVVVMSSMSGKFGWKERTAYSASKFALHGFYESLRAELFEFNISVLIVCPGRIKTNISLNAITKDGSTHQKMDKGQLNGIDVDICASKILNAIKKNKKELIIAREERIVYFFRRFLPQLYYRIAARRNPNV